MKTLKSFLKNLILALVGILSAALGIKGFLIPNNFIDGGVTGISMLISSELAYSLPLVILLINTPFVFFSIYKINRKFAMTSALAILGLAAVLAFAQIPAITDDKLLSAVFGGFFLGAGIGFAIRGGAVLDGTEILALILSRRIGVTVGDVILIVNILIFSVGAFFLGAEIAMYSILTYYSASRTVDFMIHGIEEFIGVTIISENSTEIKNAIMNDKGWGLTVYKAKRGLPEVDQDVLFCTVTRLEIPEIRRIINEIDSTAFIVMHNIHDTSGGMVKRKLKKVLTEIRTT